MGDAIRAAAVRHDVLRLDVLGRIELRLIVLRLTELDRRRGILRTGAWLPAVVRSDLNRNGPGLERLILTLISGERIGLVARGDAAVHGRQTQRLHRWHRRACESRCPLCFLRPDRILGDLRAAGRPLRVAGISARPAPVPRRNVGRNRSERRRPSSSACLRRQRPGTCAGPDASQGSRPAKSPGRKDT